MISDMPNKTESRDLAVLSVLTTTPKRFANLSAEVRTAIADERKVDRTLQRLRKAGKAKFISGPKGGWVKVS